LVALLSRCSPLLARFTIPMNWVVFHAVQTRTSSCLCLGGLELFRERVAVVGLVSLRVSTRLASSEISETAAFSGKPTRRIREDGDNFSTGTNLSQKAVDGQRAALVS